MTGCCTFAAAPSELFPVSGFPLPPEDLQVLGARLEIRKLGGMGLHRAGFWVRTHAVHTGSVTRDYYRKMLAEAAHESRLLGLESICLIPSQALFPLKANRQEAGLPSQGVARQSG